MECSALTITTLFYWIHLGILYRPPDGSVPKFSQELAEFLEQNINSAGELLLMGDLNIQVNCDNNQDTITLLDTLNEFWLKESCQLSNTLITEHTRSNSYHRTDKDHCFQMST